MSLRRYQHCLSHDLIEFVESRNRIGALHKSHKAIMTTGVGMKDAKYSTRFHKADRQVDALSAVGIDFSRRNGNGACFLKKCGGKISLGQVYSSSGGLSGPKRKSNNAVAK